MIEDLTRLYQWSKGGMTFAKYGLLGYVFWISFLNLLDSDLKLLISIVSEFVSGQLLRFSILILNLRVLLMMMIS